MTAHMIGAVNTIANLGPIAGIGNSSIAIFGIVNIDVVIIDRFFVVIIANIVVSNNTTNTVSTQRHPSSNPRQPSQIRMMMLRSTKY